MKFLHVIPSIDPKSGGPAEDLLRLYIALTYMGHSGEILCLDAPEKDFITEFPGKVNALGPSVGRYGYQAALVPWLRRHASQYDAVIVNGLWQYLGFAVWRVLRKSSTPYFVFSHGMLDPWFKQKYPLKHLKKWLYWPWAEYRVLRDASAVLFTCDEERLLARQSFWLYRCREAISSFGTSDPPRNGLELARRFGNAFPETQGKRIVLFLGRIHEKKGCDLLVEAFARVSAKTPDLHLVMAGPDDHGWTRQLNARAEELGVSSHISWTGMVSGDLKWGAFYACEVFCLPSHQENFGVAVAEALACGRPVLISNKVNIWREIEADDAGYVETDSLHGTQLLLDRWLETSPDNLSKMSESAVLCFNQRFRIETVAQNLVQIIRPSEPTAAATEVLSARMDN